MPSDRTALFAMYRYADPTSAPWWEIAESYCAYFSMAPDAKKAAFTLRSRARQSTHTLCTLPAESSRFISTSAGELGLSSRLETPLDFSPFTLGRQSRYMMTISPN